MGEFRVNVPWECAVRVFRVSDVGMFRVSDVGVCRGSVPCE